MKYYKIRELFPRSYQLIARRYNIENLTNDDLFDFFDGENYYINIFPDFETLDKTTFSFVIHYFIDDTMNRYEYDCATYTREDCVEVAFKKAFEIYENYI